MILVLVQGMFYKDKVKPIMFCFTCISPLLSPAIALFIGISRIRWNWWTALYYSYIFDA